MPKKVTIDDRMWQLVSLAHIHGSHNMEDARARAIKVARKAYDLGRAHQRALQRKKDKALVAQR